MQGGGGDGGGGAGGALWIWIPVPEHVENMCREWGKVEGEGARFEEGPAGRRRNREPDGY